MNFKQKDNALLGLVISAILATGSGQAVADVMIVNDGTLKAGTVSVHDNNEGGKIYSIDGKQLGKTVGKNLFFSFSEFNINKQDTAQFSCNGCVVNKIENGSIRNIISRVTGSNSSTINGTLDYHHVEGVVDANIRNANFWLFNPNGVVLGQGAVVDVPAELHLASASQLNLKTGKVLVALTTPPSSLTAAQPQDFGFLGNEQDITFAPGTTQLKAAGAIEIIGSNLVIAGKSTLQRPARVLFENSGASKLDVNLKTPLLSESNAGNITIGSKALLFVRTPVATLAVNAANDLTNQAGAIIKGKAQANHDLNNAGKITISAKAGNDLINDTTGVIGTQGNPASFAKAGNNLKNNYVIRGNADAGGALDNSGTIGGKAIAGTGTLTNTGTIEANARAGSALDNSGIIGGKAIAGTGTLTNTGTIEANARAGSALNNSGTIGGKAIAGTVASGALTNQSDGYIGKGAESRHRSDITNDGVIAGDVLASNNLTNNGTINGNAYAIKGALQNDTAGKITENARAGGALDNWGSIGGKAIAGAGINAPSELTNHGSIGKGAESRQSDIFNDGEITGDTFASNTLTNNGTINGNVYAMKGALQNDTAGKITENARAGGALNNWGIIDGKAIAGAGIKEPSELTNHGSIGKGAESRFRSDIFNDGEITGDTFASNTLTNNGTINGNVYAIKGALQNDTAGKITENARAGGALDNWGRIGGKAIAGIKFKGTLTNQRDATIGNGAETRNLSDIDNFGKIYGNVSAANQLNNSGNIETLSVVAGKKITLTQGGTITSTANNTDKTQLLNIVAREEMEINDGYIIAGDSGQAMSPTNLRIATPIINLTAGHIRDHDGAIDIRPDDAVGASAYAESYPAQLNFFGDSSVWAYGDIGTPHNSRSITSTSNGLGDTSIYYTVNFGHSFSNIIGSETAKVLLSTDDIKSLSAVPTNMATLLLPTTEEDWQRQLLLTGNRLINAYANSPETPFTSPQPGNLVSLKPTVIFRPQFIPVVASDPCGQGSTLEIRNTKGVILQFDKLLPFSVFPEANDQNKQDKSLNAVMANPEPLVLARLGGKGRACSKG